MRTGWAFAISALLHLFALGTAARLILGAGEDTKLAELDMSSVELSFSERPEERAEPVAALPPPQEETRSVKPPEPPAVKEPEPPPLTVADPDAPSAPKEPELKEKEFKPRELETPEYEPPPKEEKAEEKEPEEEEEEKPPREEVKTEASAPAVPAPEQARVEATTPARQVRPIRPVYPRGSRERGEEGSVTLELEVSAEGRVTGVKVVKGCGYAKLEAAAERAVRKARFKPARRGEVAVKSVARVELVFRLKD